MAYTFSFTVTQVVNNFTATVSSPLQMVLSNTPDTVSVTESTATISVNNVIQPVSITGGTVVYNQGLNTTDNVSFASLTTPAIYGTASQPVSFPTGINVSNFGTIFNGPLDFSSIYTTMTNILSLLLAAAPIDLGTVTFESQITLNFGTI